MVETIVRNLRYAARKIVRAPVFSAIAILTLGVGIGSNAAIFSVVDGVLLKPLPFEDPDRLVGIWHTAPGLGFEDVNQSPGLHFTYAADARSFSSVGMWDNAQASVSGLEEPAQVSVMHVTHQTLPMLGVAPALGRVFTAAEDTPEGPHAVVLAHGYWRSAFGADPGVLGRSIVVNGITREIVGVMPETFTFLRFDPALYLPFRLDESRAFVGNFSYQGIGRLAAGATIADANAEIDALASVATERYPGGITRGMLDQARFGAAVRPLERDVVGDIAAVLWVLLGTVGIVLLIACANVANLFIVRTEGMHREIAVRTAMGASRSHIIGQLLTETVALGLAAGLLGLLLSLGGLELLRALGPEGLPRLSEIGVDGRIVAFVVVISVGAGLFFGLLPAIQHARPRLSSALKEGGRGGGAGRERHVARNALVVTQVALALVLLTGSGLMMRSFRALTSVDPGIAEPERLLTFRVAVPTAEVEDPDQVARLHRDILERVRASPGVTFAAFSSSVTMDGFNSNDGVEVEEFPVEGDAIPPIRRIKWIGEGYFETMGMTMLAGRPLSASDIEEQRHAAVVSESIAREYWADPGMAVGKRLRMFAGTGTGAIWAEIVGVVQDVRDDGLTDPVVPTVYWPHAVANWYGTTDTFTARTLGYVARVTAGNPSDLLPLLRQAVWDVNPNLPLANVATGNELVDRSAARTSFTLTMLAIAAGVALFLGAVGIYGVISYVVTQRTREIGVRVALGARRVDVRGMVLRQAGALALAGIVIGTVAAALSTRMLASLLFGVSPLDPLTFGSVAILLATIALLAAYVPARRASAIEPVVALRAE